MLILAHRGKHSEAPENTLEAFHQAIEGGVDGIETDVRLDSEGETILFHNRCAPDGRPVDTLSRQKLSQIAGYRVPSLAEALEVEVDILWNLEIKTHAAALPTIALLKPLCQKRRILCTSFIHPIVYNLVLELEVDGGLLIAHEPIRPYSGEVAPFRSHPRLRSLVCDYETISAETLHRATISGLHTYVYNVATREDHLAVKHYGVHGLITDHTEYLFNKG